MNRPPRKLDRSSAVMYAADLTEECVDFIKGDVTDPTRNFQKLWTAGGGKKAS
ncbi:MAG: hypothetical protein HY298_03030 [Verrucomicrobia bacterium]|nr:hypothetical protein [Verrucomicrobiota bacterium]